MRVDFSALSPQGSVGSNLPWDSDSEQAQTGCPCKLLFSWVWIEKGERSLPWDSLGNWTEQPNSSHPVVKAKLEELGV